MSRLFAALPLAVALLHGCTCGGRSPAVRADASPLEMTSEAAAAPPLPSADTAAVFSAPIAAARVSGGNVVAGLVAADGVVRVTRVADDGSTVWTTDALPGVSWGMDAELGALAAGNDAAIVWRGPHDGSSTRALLVLGRDTGELQGPPVDIGSSFCGTSDGFAWLETQPGGRTRVRARRWSEASVSDVGGLAPERDASLVCGDHAVLVLGDGEDDLTLTSFLPGDAKVQPSVVAIRDSDFGDDDEREHDAYSVGEDLGLVWVGGSGTLMLRDVPRTGLPTRWRRLKHAVGEDDDVVAVDGDAESTFVVYTHGVDDACPELSSTATSVRVVVANRAAGTDARFELAAPSCDRSPGPFWIAPAPGGTVVAWVERATRLASDAAPIVGVALRRFSEGTVRASQIELAADAVVDAGCDERACFLAALLRPQDNDGMAAAPVRLIPYP